MGQKGKRVPMKAAGWILVIVGLGLICSGTWALSVSTADWKSMTVLIFGGGYIGYIGARFIYFAYD